MSAKAKYPTPGEQLLELGLKAREEGLSFDEFWDRAVPPPKIVLDRKTNLPRVEEDGREKIRPSRYLPRMDEVEPPVGAVLWPRDTQDRRDAYEATVACRDGWKRAYEGMPPLPRETALVRLRPFLNGGLAELGEGSTLGAGVPLLA